MLIPRQHTPRSVPPHPASLCPSLWAGNLGERILIFPSPPEASRPRPASPMSPGPRGAAGLRAGCGSREGGSSSAAPCRPVPASPYSAKFVLERFEIVILQSCGVVSRGGAGRGGHAPLIPNRGGRSYTSQPSLLSGNPKADTLLCSPARSSSPWHGDPVAAGQAGRAGRAGWRSEARGRGKDRDRTSSVAMPGYAGRQSAFIALCRPQAPAPPSTACRERF